MKVGILCAGDREVTPILSMIHEHQVTEKAMLKFHEGTIGEVAIVTLFSGVCKTNAAIATQILIDHFDCQIIINCGTAGGMDKRLHPMDTVISEEVAYHDVHEEILTKFHPWLESIYFKADPELLDLAKKTTNTVNQQHRFFFGRMMTGEQFIQDEQREMICNKYAPLSVDMETASIAHVCYVNKVPFISVRTITDLADQNSSDHFDKNCDQASQLSANFVSCMLKELFLRQQSDRLT